MSFDVGPKNRIDLRLILLFFVPEPIQDILVDTNGNGLLFGRHANMNPGKEVLIQSWNV